MYHLRNRNLENIEKGDVVDLKFFFSKKVFAPDLIFEGKEKKKIKKLGTYNTLHFRPELIVGKVFGDNKHMDVWVSDDENLIPLLIESPVSIGSVKVLLKSSEGLIAPLEEHK